MEDICEKYLILVMRNKIVNNLIFNSNNYNYLVLFKIVLDKYNKIKKKYFSLF
jgi:hypothetical protein